MLALAIAPPSIAAPRARPTPPRAAATVAVPGDGSVELPIENLEGLILIPAKLTGPSGVDTSGVLILDTGAGYLGLDLPVAVRLGVTESAEPPEGVELADTRLRRLEIGSLQIDQVGPILVIDASIIRRAAGRAVLGLAGVDVFRGRALWIDYERERLVLIPAPPAEDTSMIEPGADAAVDAGAVRRSRDVFGTRLSRRARAARFTLKGDQKLMVRARFANGSGAATSRWLNFVLDTGATKSVLFEPAFSESVGAARNWPSLKGLIAPTLLGTRDARLVLAPRVELEASDGRGALRRDDVDCAAVETPIGATISNAVERPVSGLLGYSFIKGGRLGLDFTNGVAWIDPEAHARSPRPYEYSQVGIQLERSGERVLVLGVAEGSPAEQAGIRVGDELLSLGGHPVSPGNITQLTAALEGPPGTRVRLVIARDGTEHSYVLSRRRLL